MSQELKTKRGLRNPMLSYLLETDDLEPALAKMAWEIAAIDRRYEPMADASAAADAFLNLMRQNIFWPAPLMLLNATDKHPLLASHVALPLNDGFEVIFDTLKRTTALSQQEIQVALDFSMLRAARSSITSSHAQSAGPVKFMQLFQNVPQPPDTLTPMRFQLAVDHANIQDFLAYVLKAPGHIRCAVGLTGDFLAALQAGGTYTINTRSNTSAVKALPAADIFKAIIKIIAKGLPIDFIFLDNLERLRLRARLPESMLLNGQNQLVTASELMMTGTFNPTPFVVDGDINVKNFDQALTHAVHFLDNAIEHQHYADSLLQSTTQQHRRLGISFIGLEAYLSAVLGRRRSSETDARALARLIDTAQMSLIKASQTLGRLRGMHNRIRYRSAWHETRHVQLLAQIHQPLLCQIADTPAYFFKREMKLSDFFGMYPLHKLWQEGLGNIASLKHPIKALDPETFSRVLFSLHEAGLPTLELTS